MTTAHVDIADLRQDLPAWLERARGGDELVVTDHGAAIARIVPPADARADARRALEALRPHARVGDVESPLGEPWEAADGNP
jgi:prevent-host-death family protein